MSAVATPPRPAQLPLAPDGEGAHTELRRSGGGRLTLEQRLERAWEGLLTAGAAECPMCGAEMRREAAEGHCTGCGTVLS